MGHRYSIARNVAAAILALLLLDGGRALAWVHATANSAPVLTYYVSVTGGDSNNGLTTGTAFATPAHAQSVVETQIVSGSPTMAVDFLTGTYRLTSSWTFTSADSPLPGRHITWQSASSNTAIISGSVQVPNSWSVCTSGACQTAGGYKISLPTASGYPADFREAYFGGTHGTRVRGAYQPSGWTVNISTALYTTPSSGTQPLSTSLNPTHIEVVSGDGWQTTYCPITTPSGSTLPVTFSAQSPCSTNMIAAFWPAQTLPGTQPTPMWIENQYELLPTCGQGCWYWDPVGTILYYVPRTGENMATLDVELPAVASPLVSLSGVHNIEFDRLIFEHSTWLDPDSSGHGYVEWQSAYYCPASGSCETPSTGLRLPAGVDIIGGSHDLAFNHDEFTHLAGRAMFMAAGTQNVTVYAALCQDSSGGCIQVGEISDYNQSNPALYTKNITIKDLNCTASPDFEYHGGGCVYAPNTVNLSIDHSAADHLYWVAFATGNLNNFASNYNANNSITNSKTNTICTPPYEDCGDFYTNGPEVVSYSNNYSTGIGGNSTRYREGTYFVDSYSNNLTFTNNVTDSPLTTNSCNYNINTGNCFVYANGDNTETGVSIQNEWTTNQACFFYSIQTTCASSQGLTVSGTTTIPPCSGSTPGTCGYVEANAGIEAGVTPGP